MNMENNKILLSQDIENVQGTLSGFFTPDRIKYDFFEGKEREICVVHNYTNESYEMELSIHDEFTVMSFAIKFEFRGLSIICLDVAVGGLDASSGYPIAGKCYIEMEYNTSLKLCDCILRDFY
jgi:hypothetical protein